MPVTPMVSTRTIFPEVSKKEFEREDQSNAGADFFPTTTFQGHPCPYRNGTEIVGKYSRKYEE